MISVIVCAYNEEKLITHCLQALANQNFPTSEFEVVIIDDESTDNTSKLCKEFISNLDQKGPKFKYYRIEHAGLSVARNEGINNSHGDIICFIDADALADPQWLTNYNNTFLNPQIHYSSGRIILLNEDSTFANILQKTRFNQKFSPPYNNHFHGVNMAFRRDIFLKVGGFYENFESRGDDTTFRNIVKKHYTYEPTPTAVVKHERPESLEEWFNIFLKELNFQYLVFKALNHSSSTFYYIVPLLKSLIIDTLFLLGFFWWPAFILAILAFLISKRKHLFIKTTLFSKEWLFNWSYHIIDTFLRPFYFIKSYLIYHNEPIIPANSKKPEIKKKISN